MRSPNYIHAHLICGMLLALSIINNVGYVQLCKGLSNGGKE